jgi:hypothetical protein
MKETCKQGPKPYIPNNLSDTPTAFFAGKTERKKTLLLGIQRIISRK